MKTIVYVVDCFFGKRHSRCPGCGEMDEDLVKECVGYGFSHHPVEVDRYGDIPKWSVPQRLDYWIWHKLRCAWAKIFSLQSPDKPNDPPF